MRLFKSMFVLLGLAVPLVFSGAQAAEEKKAKTIAELAAMYDSSSCMECHTEVHEQWQESLHARSIFGPENTGRTAATIKTTIENGLKEWPYSGVKKPEDVGVKHLMICAKCHLPQLQEAEDSVAKEIVKNVYAFADDGDEEAAEALQSLNIGCTVCHNRNAIVHKWTDGKPEKNAVYGNTEGAHEDEAHPVMKQSKIMKESILCGQCHGMGPNFDLENPTQCATLYGAHLYTYIPEGGQETCQECHMEKSGLGHNMQSYRSEAMAKMALEVEVEAQAYQWRDGSTMTPLANVIVEIKNKAGHPIPDGWPTPNRVVLYVTAKTNDGKVFYTNEKIYMPIPQQMGRGDKMGRGPYEKSALLRDTSLPPLKVTREQFSIPVYNETTKDDKLVRAIIANDFTVDVEVWYLPYGKKEDPGNAQKWFAVSKKMHIEEGGK